MNDNYFNLMLRAQMITSDIAMLKATGKIPDDLNYELRILPNSDIHLVLYVHSANSMFAIHGIWFMSAENIKSINSFAQTP